MSGVTYYKLEQRYEGDRTKGCGLTSAEVDANFHFLRGYDIKDAKLSDDGILTLYRVNCDEIVIDNLPEIIQEITDNAIASSEKPFNFSGSTYDPDSGVLTIKLNGAEFDIPGFEDTDFDFKLHVGYGLDGDGTKSHPVRLSLANQTGFFAPVELVFDGEPYDGKVKRYITKEQTSPYGLLYDFENTQKLDEYLAEHGNGWRVATEDDWQDLFDSVQCDEIATALKDKKFEDGQDTDFKVLPTEYVDTKKYASFWSVGVDDCRDGYPSKGFIENDPDVHDNAASINKLRSIRLVKDGNLPNTEVETICGNLYRTLKIGSLVWTVDNACFENNEIKGEKPCGLGNILSDDEYENSAVEKYFINENDTIAGTVSKKELPANGVVMIHEYSGLTDEEWVVVEDPEDVFTLKSRSSILKEEYIDPELQAVYLAIESVELELMDTIEDVKEEVDFHTEILSALTLSAETLESDINDINDTISELSDAVSDHENRIAELESVSADTRLEDIEQFADSTDARISELEAVSADTRLEALEAHADGSDEASNVLSEKVAKNEEDIAALQTKTEKTDEEVSRISNSVDKIISAVTESTEAIDDNFNAIEEEFTNVYDKMITGVKENGTLLEKDGNNVVDVRVPFSALSVVEKILTLTDDGVLESHFKAVYDSDSKKIRFYGNYDSVGGADREICPPIDASDFIKDGILDSADIVTIDGEKCIKLVFKTADGDRNEFIIKVADLLTEYEGDGTFITVDGNRIVFNPSSLDPKFAQYEPKQDFEKIVGSGFTDGDTVISLTHKINEVVSAMTNQMQDLKDDIDEYASENNYTFEDGFKVAGLLSTLGTGYYNDPAHQDIGGKTVMEVLKNILRRELYPHGQQPKATIEFDKPGEFAEGDGDISLAYTITLDPGKYYYDDGSSVGSQINVDGYVVTLRKDGEPFASASSTVYTPVGSITGVTLTPGSTYTLSVSLPISSNYTPVTNFGKEVGEAKIETALPITADSTTRIEIYRPIKYALLNDTDVVYDYDHGTVEISGVFNNINTNQNFVNIKVDAGTETIAILVPRMEDYQRMDLYSLDKILDLGTGLDLKEVFYENKMATTVDGYLHSAYIYNPAGDNLNETVYRLKISKNS